MGFLWFFITLAFLLILAFSIWPTQSRPETRTNSDLHKDLGDLKKEVADLKDAVREKKS